jgi:hypothetical protein
VFQFCKSFIFFFVTITCLWCIERRCERERHCCGWPHVASHENNHTLLAWTSRVLCCLQRASLPWLRTMHAILPCLLTANYCATQYEYSNNQGKMPSNACSKSYVNWLCGISTQRSQCAVPKNLMLFWTVSCNDVTTVVATRARSRYPCKHERGSGFATIMNCLLESMDSF